MAIPLLGCHFLWNYNPTEKQNKKIVSVFFTLLDFIYIFAISLFVNKQLTIKNLPNYWD